MTRSSHQYVAILAAAVGVLTLGTKAFSHDERPSSLTATVERARAATAVVKLFLKIDGVEGESRDAAHDRSIELESFSWGATGGSTIDRTSAKLQDLQVVARTSKATVALAEALVRGMRFQKATLSIVRAGGEYSVEYLTYSLGDVGISTLQVGGSAASSSLDQIALSYRSLDITYREQRPDGTVASPITVSLAPTKM